MSGISLQQVLEDSPEETDVESTYLVTIKNGVIKKVAVVAFTNTIIPNPQLSKERQFLCFDTDGLLRWILLSEIGIISQPSLPTEVADGGSFTEITDGQPSLDGGDFQDTSTGTTDGGTF